MRLACLIVVTCVMAWAARGKLRDRHALQVADVFTGAYMAGWGDALASAQGLADDCDDEACLHMDVVHYDAQVNAARRGLQ